MPKQPRQRIVFTVELYESTVLVQGHFSDQSGPVAATRRSHSVPPELRESGVDIRDMLGDVDALSSHAARLARQGRLW